MTLAALIGGSTEQAARLLDCEVAISWNPSDPAAGRVARHLEALLSRTVSRVAVNTMSHSSAQVVIGDAVSPVSEGLRVSLGAHDITIGKDAPIARMAKGPPIVELLTACYAAGMAIKMILGPGAQLPGPQPAATLAVPLSALLGVDARWASSKMTFDLTYLAGAGAIGNAFVYALGLFDVAGDLIVVDHDEVSDGNRNRCLYFEVSDIGQSKARVLVRKASSRLPAVRMHAERTSLEKLGKSQQDPRWLRRLVVGVDSRRARRSLQMELPGEVFDASTTGVLECVFHYHRQPTDFACLACIYHESVDEQAHERHVAATLGVSLEHVQERVVSSAAAELIAARYPNLSAAQVVDQSYDSLFKALCGQGLLRTNSSQQVLAPFAFVSVLAGAYLAIEFVRRLSEGRDELDFNYWRLSPWAAPVPQLRSMRPQVAGCSCCGQPLLARVARELWS